jgi:phosphonate transport system ATP-binding protein
MMIVEGLYKSYEGRPVLEEIHFPIEKGEFIALLGKSGSGKSTLFRCLTLQEAWEKGTLNVNGRKISGLVGPVEKGLRQKWAFIQQKPSLIGRRTALENVVAGRLPHIPLWRLATGRLPSIEKDRAMEALKRLGLGDLAHQRADRLSGGEQQRVAIARAWVQGAEWIIADEPISSLDPQAAERVMMDLSSLTEEGVTVLCSLHQVEWAEAYATRILALAHGKMVLDIPGRELSAEEKVLIYC